MKKKAWARWGIMALAAVLLAANFYTGFSVRLLSDITGIKADLLDDVPGPETPFDIFRRFSVDSEGLVYGAVLYHDNVKAPYSGLKYFLDGKDGDSFSAYKSQKSYDENMFGDYASQTGFQGLLAVGLSKILPMEKAQKAAATRLVNTVLTVLALVGLLYWIYKIFGFLAAAACYLYIGFADVVFITFAPNVYWAVWTWFLPMLGAIWVCSRAKEGEICLWQGCGLAFLTLLVKCMCGFEYITTITIAMLVPYVYYAFKYEWGVWDAMKKLLATGASAVLGFFTAVGVYLLQFSLRLGSFAAALEKLQTVVFKRIPGDLEIAKNMGQQFYESLTVPFLDVVKKYVLQPLGPLRYGYFLLVFALGAVLFLVLLKKRGAVRPDWMHFWGLCAAGALAAAGTLSWPLFAKGHAFIHWPLSAVLWDVPFTLFAISLFIAAVVKLFSKKKS